MPLPSRYSSLQIPPYIGSGRRELDEPGFMPLHLYMWIATLMRTKDCTENVMICDRDVHMPGKVAALDDPPQVCSLQLTKRKRSDGARRYHHEVTQRVQARIDQTRSAQCELWFQFGIPITVILKLTLGPKTDFTDRGTASAASAASARSFRSFRRFYVSFLISLISYLV